MNTLAVCCLPILLVLAAIIKRIGSIDRGLITVADYDRHEREMDERLIAELFAKSSKEAVNSYYMRRVEEALRQYQKTGSKVDAQRVRDAAKAYTQHYHAEKIYEAKWKAV